MRSLLGAIQVVRTKVDAVEFDMILDMGSNWVDMETAKVRSKLFLLHWPDILKVLVAENNDTTLSNEESKLILLDI